MAAILNGNFILRWDFGDLHQGIKWQVGIQVTFLKMSAFSIFPGWHNFWANGPGLVRDIWGLDHEGI